MGASSRPYLRSRQAFRSSTRALPSEVPPARPTSVGAAAASGGGVGRRGRAGAGGAARAPGRGVATRAGPARGGAGRRAARRGRRGGAGPGGGGGGGGWVSGAGEEAKGVHKPSSIRR